ncbi:MAG: class I SAM-dependent methyltransferase [Hyphomicrobiaceae bacterium]
MLDSHQRLEAPLSAQVEFWNAWNAKEREDGIARVSIEQADTVMTWLHRLDRVDLNILEVGCGAGWLCSMLAQFGAVTGTDLSDQVLARAALRAPSVRFVAGDFMTLDLAKETYDVVACLEVLSHVDNQPEFISKIASVLRPGGYLMLATQNRPQLERNDIPPPMPGQIRNWVDRSKLSDLVAPQFDIEELFSITPIFNTGYMRYVTSHKLHLLLSKLGAGSAVKWLTKKQEAAWMGWTLMTLARKPGNLV